jgi:hypothetical protein
MQPLDRARSYRPMTPERGRSPPAAVLFNICTTSALLIWKSTQLEANQSQGCEMPYEDGSGAFCRRLAWFSLYAVYSSIEVVEQALCEVERPVEAILIECCI